jgi:hypothetical protein
VLVSTLLTGFLQVAAPEATPDAFMAVFTTTCMKYYDSSDKLRAAMKASGTAALTGDAAAFFLSRRPGTAWGVSAQERRYIVALRDDGICTVFAQQADVDAVRQGFTRLVSKASPPLEARSLPGGPSGGGVVQTTTYAWSRPADETQLVFTLTTSTSPAAPVQAMASVALTAK